MGGPKLVRAGWSAGVLAIMALAISRIEQPLSGPRRTLMDPGLVTQGLEELGITARTYTIVSTGRIVLLATFLLGVALTITWRAAETRGGGVFALVLSGFGAVLLLDVLGPSAGPGRLGTVLGTLVFTSAFFAFYIFPDGRFVPRWTAWLMPLWGVAILASGFPEATAATDRIPSPVTEVFFAALFLSCPAALVLRYRNHSDPAQRQQVKWVAFGLGIMVVAYLAFWVGPELIPGSLDSPRSAAFHDLIGGTLLTVGFGALPAGLAMALLRLRLWGVDPIMGRTLVFSGLTAAVVMIYIGVVSYLGAVLGLEEGRAVSLVATGIVAVAVQPMRSSLQRGVNRFLYGRRSEPYEAITQLGRSLEVSGSPEDMLEVVVDTVRDVLRLPHVSIQVEDGDRVVRRAESGRAIGDLVVFPLVHGSERVGAMTLSPRSPDGHFTRPEVRLLTDLARHAGGVARAVGLTAQLQHARESLVQAREEERRWLSQELHDGLGPLLASQTLTIAAAHRAISSDPGQAGHYLEDAINQAQSAIDDVRRIVLGLRPPILDSLGIEGALGALASDLGAGGLSIEVSITAPPSTLSAAAEVACYRIAQEALTNVVRHSGAASCRLSLTVNDRIVLSVEDSGRGIRPNTPDGVGLTSMRNRAEELGGTLDITSTADHGTVVRASIPRLGAQ